MGVQDVERAQHGLMNVLSNAPQIYVEEDFYWDDLKENVRQRCYHQS